MEGNGHFVGIVKWFDSGKGYGFIGVDNKEDAWPLAKDKDVFVHYTGIIEAGYKTLSEGERVSFIVSDGSQGRLQADRVTKLGKNTNETKQENPEIIIQEQTEEASL